MANYVQFFLTYSGTKTTSEKDFLSSVYNLQLLDTRAFLNQPEGLGMSKELIVNRIGDDARLTGDNEIFDDITGEIIFSTRDFDNRGNWGSYKSYEYFMQFCKRSGLSLCVVRPNAQGYEDLACRRVVLKSIEKGEIDYKTGHLRCKVAFSPLSLWVGGKVNYYPSGSRASQFTNYITKTSDNRSNATITFQTKGNVQMPLSIWCDGYPTAMKRFRYELFYTDTNTRVGAGCLNKATATAHDMAVTFLNGRWSISPLSQWSFDISFRESSKPFMMIYLSPNTKYTLKCDATPDDDSDAVVQWAIGWDDLYDSF